MEKSIVFDLEIGQDNKICDIGAVQEMNNTALQSSEGTS